nr:PD-(D/E)XK nuclease family protein [Candidatus Cloacimonadota bacterium]
ELGLKTYEDITLRDKYYFYRLLCNCRKAVIFTRSNQEEDVEISSFLEELKLHDLVQEETPLHFAELHKQLFGKLLNSAERTIPSPKNLPENFFAFPFDPADFPNQKFDLNFYSWEKLKNNPFEFYLKQLNSEPVRKSEIETDFSGKLIGNITHEVINDVFKRLTEVYHSNRFQHNFVWNTKLYVQQAIEHYTQFERNFKYLSPHNFSENYFRHIFLPLLADGIENFFYRLHNDFQFSEKTITVLPESGASLERDFIRWHDLEICLKGRPDLRIHTEEKKYIFDFKTGVYSRQKNYEEQLQFYEEIYYLIDHPNRAEEIASYLFFVEQKEMKKPDKRIDMKESITNVLENILENGFAVTDKPGNFEETDITRRDLKTPSIPLDKGKFEEI